MRFSRGMLCIVVALSLSSSAGDAAKNYPTVVRAALGLAVDAQGNKYLGGSFSGTADLNSSKGTDVRISRSQGEQKTNQYIVRIDANGDYRWVQQFGGSMDDTAIGNGGAAMRITENSGTIYVVTTFQSIDATLGDGASASPGALSRVASQGSFDVAILALNASTGAPVTTFGGGDGIVTFGGTGTEGARSITIHAGTLYASGALGSSDAGIDGPGTNSTATGDIFVLALDAATGAPRTSFGNLGVRVFGEPGKSQTPGEIAVSGPTLYLAGTFEGTTGTPGAGGRDAFVAALDAASGLNVPTFSVDGIQSLGGSDIDGATGCAVNNGIVYVSGSFRSTNFGIGGSGSVSTSGISDGFIAALNVSDGSPVTSLGTGGIARIGGPGGSETIERILISDNVLYGSGYGSTRTLAITELSTDFQLLGFFDAYLIALNSFTGVPLASFGNNDGLISVGGSEFPGKSVTGTPPFTFSRDLAIWERKAIMIGTSNAKSIQIDNTGEFDLVGFGGFIVEANTVFDVKPPIFADPNPTRSGLTVTLTVTGTVAQGTVTWNFGDGSPTQQGNPVTHVYTSAADTTFFATAVSSFGGLSLPVKLVVPNVPNVANIGDGVSVTEPLNGLSIKLDRSEGGVLEFLTDITTLRANEDVITKVVLGNNADIIPTRRAIFKATTPGIAVATSVAKNGDLQRGRVRKMAAVSSREIGTSNALPAAPDKNITIDSLAGKFLFTSEKADSVTFKGTVQLPAGLDLSNPNGVEVFIGIGNVVDRVVVTSKGKGDASDLKVVKKAAVKFPKLKGTTITAGGEKTSVQVQFSLANLDQQGFDTEGIVAQLAASEQGSKSVQRSIQIALVIAGVSYEAQAPVDFKLSSKADSGQIKGRRAN